MKAIMIADKPIWCRKMMNGDKTVEVRTSKALANAIQKLIDEYGYADIYVYCTKQSPWIYWNESVAKINNGRGCVIGYKSLRNDNGKVLFKFRCYKVEEITATEDRYGEETWYETYSLACDELAEKSCLDFNELDEYMYGKNGNAQGYAIHISDLVIFDKPKELSEFNAYSKCKRNLRTRCLLCHALATQSGDYCIKKLTKAPQNFCYVYVESEE